MHNGHSLQPQLTVWALQITEQAAHKCSPLHPFCLLLLGSFRIVQITIKLAITDRQASLRGECGHIVYSKTFGDTVKHNMHLHDPCHQILSDLHT